MISKEEVIIFYLFHDRPELTANRLVQLLALNGSIQVIACYGGPSSLFDQSVKDVLQFSTELGMNIERSVNFVCTTVKEPWYNIDLLPADWFARYGHEYKFEVLLYIEYDVLLIDSVSDTLSQISSKYNKFDFASCLTDSIKTPNWDWLKRPSSKRFLTWRDEHFHISPERPIFNAFAPIYFISRSALKEYAAFYTKNMLPNIFVEIRLPNILDLLSFRVIDAEFSPTVRWRPSYTSKEIDDEIRKLHEKPGNLHPIIFHPFYEMYQSK